jgi:hypothetical protein
MVVHRLEQLFSRMERLRRGGAWVGLGQGATYVLLGWSEGARGRLESPNFEAKNGAFQNQTASKKWG